MLILPLVVFTDTPSGVNFFHEILYPLFLLLLADMAEKFHDKIPVVGELPFKAPDAVDTLLVGLLIHLSVNAVSCDFVHPAGVQKHKFSCLRYFRKVTAKKRLSFFLLCGLIHRCHLKKSGIDIPDHLADHASLSGSSPAFHKHQNGKLVFLDQRLLSGKLFPCSL